MMTCTICRHSQREAIEHALIDGTPLRHIASLYSTSTTSLRRHRQHLSMTLQLAVNKAKVVHAESLLERMDILNAKAIDLMRQAQKKGDLRTALAAIDTLRKNQELIGRLRGELGPPKANKTVACVPVDDQKSRAALQMALQAASEDEISQLIDASRTAALPERMSRRR